MAFLIELAFGLAQVLFEGVLHLAWGMFEGRPFWQRLLLSAGVATVLLGGLGLVVTLVGTAVNGLRAALA